MAGKKNFIRPLIAAIYETNCLVDLIIWILFQRSVFVQINF